MTNQPKGTMHRISITLSALALFVALTTSGALASGLIDGHSIRNGTIAAAKLTPNAVRSLRGQRGQTGPAGSAGPQGAAGFAGAPGPAGAAGGFDPSKLSTVVGPDTFVAAGQILSVFAFCNPGTTAIAGGGFNTITTLADSEPFGTTGWDLIVDNDSAIGVNVHAVVVCSAP
jgi:hypothetical protein